MKIKDLLESATSGATSSSGMSYSATQGGGTNLLGGPEYTGNNPFKKKSKKKTETIIKRAQS